MNNLIKGKILSSCCNTQDYCFFFVGLMYNYNRLSWVFLHDLSAGCTLVKLSMVCVVCLSFLRHRHNMILLSFSASPINKLCFSPYVSIIFFSFSFTLWFFEVELARLPLTLSFLSVHSPPSTPIQPPLPMPTLPQQIACVNALIVGCQGPMKQRPRFCSCLCL